jgi:predicted ATP-grasp superfamily ATP-dependent carboligase|tara:strand:- start:213 stop:455 length:243 start_codon:yes stop_codon:yes gene_type:complete
MSSINKTTISKLFMPVVVAAILGLVTWTLISIVGLKVDVATVKTDVKYISAQVETINKQLQAQNIKYDTVIPAVGTTTLK